MSPNSVRGVLADSCFLIAAFDSNDGHHVIAARLLETLREHTILMPWPVMYECFHTRTTRRPKLVESFHRFLKWPKILRIDDSSYRVKCLEESAIDDARSLSLVDRVIRAILEDARYRVPRLLTFNVGDFQDVWRTRRIDIVPRARQD